ncbi:50S ribosomal protein L18 [Patescibacteria group bacterium]|nr:50S ribosomal protein L18 [Patescibacteria group bacterium]
MSNIKQINERKNRRRLRNRAKIFGTNKRPRLSVFRSNKYTYVQLINDNTGKTLVSSSTFELNKKTKKTDTKTNQAIAIGLLIAEKAKKLEIKEIVFNKGSYLYHGRVKAVAEGVKEGGLKI